MDGLFGTPTGQIAREEQNRKNVLAEGEAWKTLGEIEAQPSKRALEAAHTRLWNATAAKEEAETQGTTNLGQLLEIANKTLPQDMSPDDRMVAVGEMALKSGLIKPAEKAFETGFGMKLKKQQIATSAANEKLHGLDARRKQLQEAGSIAQFMAQSPAQYAQGRAFLAAQGHDIADLPEDFDAAVPQLRAAAAASIAADKQIELERKRIEDADQAETRRVQRDLDRRRADFTDIRAKVKKKEYEDSLKNNGPGSSSSDRRREEMNTASKERREAAVRKEFPPLPLDPAKVSYERGKNGYMLPDGRLVYTVGKDAKGRPIFEEAK